ncbi:hypothetical protein [Zavarzinella formosa]|uniref:hypothetical protein n=1 Tax=Zavarzinella formosa TaxID=360055 RepID=UPI00031B9001
MGCQKVIAAQIVEGRCEDVLDVKDNQPTLAAAIETFFREATLARLTPRWRPVRPGF